MVIGVYIVQLDDAYQRGLWTGITKRARETGHGVIGFIGQRLDAPIATEAARNFAYYLAGPENIDALIVLASTFGTFGGIEGVSTLLAGVNLPKISVGIRIPGITGISVNGKPAMAELVRHIINDHRRRRIALIAGPQGHPEADEREAVCRSEIAAAGLAFDERLLVRGSFLADSGVEAAQYLLDSGLSFDALICQNDQMAIGAMTVLRGAGLQIPEDVVVTGFDDIQDSRWEAPPLTTVAQPLEAMGYRAFDMVLDLLAGRSPVDCDMECQLIIRQSCSCPPARQFDAGDPGVVQMSHDLDPTDRAVLDQLRLAAEAGNSANFLAVLNNALLRDQIRERTEAGESGKRLARWHELLQFLAKEVADADGIFLEGQSLISSVEIRQQAADRIEAREQHHLMRILSARLSGSFSMQTMVRQLSDGLERLRIRHGFLALFESPTFPGTRPDSQAQLLMMSGMGSDAESSGSLTDISFPCRQLLPPEYRGELASGIWILEPLVFQDEPLGYLILSADSRDPSVYDNIRDQVSSTLKGSLLMEQITGHEQELEREVLRRTKELRQVNRDLTAGIVQRQVLEREIQEISDRTMQTIGQDLHDDLCQHLAGISMFAALLETELRSLHPVSVDAVGRIRHMLENSIVRTRQIARGLYPPGLEERGLVAVLEDLVDSLASAGKVRIILQVETDFSWLDAPRSLQLFRIIQESIGNAMRHSGTDRVEVRLFIKGTLACAEVRDFGCGLPVRPDELHSRQGMGLRIMRYRAESIAAELTIEAGNPGVRIICQLERAPAPTGGTHV